MHIRQLLTQDQLNNFDESIALELIQKIEKGNIQNLSCSFLSVRAETVVLIAAALAQCPNLHTVNIAKNNLGQYGPATAEKLALAPSLHTVYMSGNHLGADGPATAEKFTHTRSLHTVYMQYNNLRGHGPETAKYLAECLNLHTVYMQYNDLAHYGPETAKYLAECPNLHTVYMHYNNLRGHGPATAAAFDSHNQYLADLKQTIHTPSMFTTVLNPDGMPPDVVDLIGVFLPPIDATVY
jgi:Ran GTPase-activating protein (RanGAP) involved in mRNA processing and transport